MNTETKSISTLFDVVKKRSMKSKSFYKYIIKILKTSKFGIKNRWYKNNLVLINFILQKSHYLYNYIT